MTAAACCLSFPCCLFVHPLIDQLNPALAFMISNYDDDDDGGDGDDGCNYGDDGDGAVVEDGGDDAIIDVLMLAVAFG